MIYFSDLMPLLEFMKMRSYVGLIISDIVFFFTRFILMGSNSVEDLLEASTEVHFSGLHLNGLGPTLTDSEAEQPTTSCAIYVHKEPFVIGW